MNWERLERTTLAIHRRVYRVGFKIHPPLYKRHNRRVVATIIDVYQWPILAAMRLSGRVWFACWKRWRWETVGRFIDGSKYDG